MFFNFKKKKVYYSCPHVEKSVILHRDWYCICSMFGHLNCIYRPILNYDEKKGFDYKKLFKVKKSIIKNMQKGIIHKGCIGCKDLKEQEWSGKCDKIQHIHFRLSRKCNAKCVYCTDDIDNSLSDRLFLKDLKKLIKKKIIAKNALMEFGGGEFTLHDEFEQIFRYLLDNGFRRYKVYTSCLKYSPELAEALGYGECEVIISADAGDRETFKKMKQADTYDRFWGNLKKYVDAQKINYTQVKSKFIIIKNMNDTKEQINSFLEKSKEIGIKRVIFDIECDDIRHFLSKPNKEMAIYFNELINYAQHQAENVYGLEFEKFSYIQLFEQAHPEQFL